MIRDITLGQYYATDSVIHRLDPRTKLVGTLAYLIALFIYTSPYVFALAAVFLISAILLSRVPFRYILKGLKPIWFLLLFTVIINMLFIKGTPLFSIWKITVSREGVEQALSMGVRLILLILGSNLMTLTTTPTRLTAGMEHLMKPLKLIGGPVHEIAMMMSIALRFIPILMDEANRIMNAQTARGADFTSGGLIRRARALIPLLVPLFVSAFRRANDLALAMESRGYHGGEGRTRMNPLVYQRRDRIAYGIIALYLVLIFLIWKYVEISLPFLP